MTHDFWCAARTHTSDQTSVCAGSLRDSSFERSLPDPISQPPSLPIPLATRRICTSILGSCGWNRHLLDEYQLAICMVRVWSSTAFVCDDTCAFRHIKVENTLSRVQEEHNCVYKDVTFDNIISIVKCAIFTSVASRFFGILYKIGIGTLYFTRANIQTWLSWKLKPQNILSYFFFLQ